MRDRALIRGEERSGGGRDGALKGGRREEKVVKRRKGELKGEG